MPFFKKKQSKEEIHFPEFPDIQKETPLNFPPYSKLELPSPRDIKDAIRASNLDELREFPKLEELPELKPMREAPKPLPRQQPMPTIRPIMQQSSKLEAMPKLTPTITYEPRPMPAGSPMFRPITMEKPLNLPVRKPMQPPSRQPVQVQRFQPVVQTEPQYAQEVRMPQQDMQPRYQVQTKPLFVQLEEYNKILEAVNNLKLSVQEAERILGNLKQLKERENSELSRWDAHLSKVKEKLTMIDKKLFEI